MRSIILALAFAAPLSAVASPNTFTKPTSRPHEAKQQEIFLTFVNYTSQDREVLVGNTLYKVRFGNALHVFAPVGSSVRVYSQTNSKINGQELLQVSADDQNRSVMLD